MPKLGDVVKGIDIGQKAIGSKFIWYACATCKKENWKLLVKGIIKSKYCKKCCKMGLPISYIKGAIPKLGDIARGEDIGQKSVSNKFIWNECLVCKKESWKIILRRIAKSKCCSGCSNMGHKVSNKTRMLISKKNKGSKRTKKQCELMSKKIKEAWAKPGHKERIKEIYKHRSRVNIDTPEFSKKMSEIAKKSWDNPEQRKVRLNARKGFKHTEETKQLISKMHRGKFVGAKSGMWKGGVSSVMERLFNHRKNRNWKLQVLHRDNYTCQECNESKVKLHAHHIVFKSVLLAMCWENLVDQTEDSRFEAALSYEPLWDTTNGITLCVDCHKEKHKKKEKV